MNDVALALLRNELPVPGTAMTPAPEPNLGDHLRYIDYLMGKKVEDMGSAIARALMAPGNALRGEYDQVGLMGNGAVTMADPRMYDDAAELAGLIGLGVMPMPRPSNSLGIGGRETFDQLLAQAKQRISSREAMVDEIVASGRKSVKMTGKAGAVLVGPDMSKSGGYRVTYFDPMGVPNGHVETSTYADAIKRALMDGFSVQQVQ